ncbi:transporter substrate-binding domain-containing protein [Paucibacter sp. APW11]|uniref:Transporter substrate-binding domain-containing protein n=1 Tax=Roseateles aquae TaxID=3077235 RepID=A0ABU3PID0_9BURK|nr:transporter substrate-binding domain-containing protein [Paucibacter sp. APW11]MDT9002219.1 transporter substrate-binding domain-containing protein [Paucibacter sp. APW11]
MLLRLCLFVAGLFVQFAATAQTPAGDELLIEYRDKPPLSYTEAQRPAGILIDKTREIFKRAGISIQLSEVPLKRIVKDIQNNQQRVCSPGWYKLVEREQYARFSLAIHQDAKQRVLVAPGALAVARSHASIVSLLADRRLQLATVNGVSYGAELDQLIVAAARPALAVSVTPQQLARMINAGRADYMFIDQDDYEYLEQQGELGGNQAQALSFSDMPAGLYRYLMCSKQVDDGTLQRINDAIRQLGDGRKR